MIKKAGIKAVSALAALLVAGIAAAAYPDKPIRMIVPFPPGGVTDTVARPIAEAMGRDLGQPVVVENKAGAGGAVGVGEAARAKPDGYTIMLMLSSISILPEADKILGRKAAYETSQFKGIGRITADPTVLMVRADSPWKSVDDLVAAAKADPGKLNYGSSGIYGSMHMPMAMFERAANVKMTHVPYTGAGPAVAALLGGQVDAIASGPSSVLQHVKAGTMRPLAHWGSEPLASMPDVPSLQSLGVDAKFVQWSAVFVPAETPADIVARLTESVRKVAQDPAVQQQILNTGSPVLYMDDVEFTKYWAEDDANLVKAVRAIGKVE